MGGLCAARGIDGGPELADDAGHSRASAFIDPEGKESGAQFGTGIIDTVFSTIRVCVLSGRDSDNGRAFAVAQETLGG